MARQREQDGADRAGQPKVTLNDLRPPKEQTPEQAALKKIQALLDTVHKEVDAQVRARPPQSSEIQISLNPEPGKTPEKQNWTLYLNGLTARNEVTRPPKQSGSPEVRSLESLEEFETRRKSELGVIIKQLYEQDIKPKVTAREVEIQSLVTETNAIIEQKIRSLPDKSDDEKNTLIKKSQLEIGKVKDIWEGPMGAGTAERSGGSIEAIIKKAVQDTLVDASKNNFDKLVNKPNNEVDVDLWIRSVTSLQDSELKKIADSKVLTIDEKEFTSDLRAIRDKLLTCAISASCVTGVAIGIGAAFPGGIGALSTGAGSLLCAGLLYKSWDLGRDFRDRIKTVWDTTIAQLNEPANMDAARAWAGVFFKVIRDFNPIYFKADTTDYWSKTEDSKVDAVLNSIKAGAIYSSEVTYEKHIAKGAEQPLLAVATDEKFGTYIKRVGHELSNLRDRWNSFPSFYKSVTVATTIFSAVGFIGHLSKYLQP